MFVESFMEMMDFEVLCMKMGVCYVFRISLLGTD